MYMDEMYINKRINVYMYTRDKDIFCKLTKRNCEKNEEKNTNKQNTKIQYNRTPNTQNCE